jgi:hypothetical protein
MAQPLLIQMNWKALRTVLNTPSLGKESFSCNLLVAGLGQPSSGNHLAAQPIWFGCLLYLGPKTTFQRPLRRSGKNISDYFK